MLAPLALRMYQATLSMPAFVLYGVACCGSDMYAEAARVQFFYVQESAWFNDCFAYHLVAAELDRVQRQNLVLPYSEYLVKRLNSLPSKSDIGLFGVFVYVQVV